MKPATLVTGGAGYVGAVCCSHLLDRAQRVTIIDNLSTGHFAAVPPDATLHTVDIGDREALSRVLASDHFDTVFHFAAKALIPESVTNPGAFFDSNVGASIAMLEVLRTAGIRKFVFSSSAAVYGDPHAIPIDEMHPKNPVNAYGESKLMLEQVLRWYVEAYRWSVVAFRYFNASGGTSTVGEDHRPETHIIPLLLQVASGEREYFEIFGTDYPTPDGTCLRDYVHVTDIAEAHVLAHKCLQEPGMHIFNIGTGISFSVKQIIRAVEQFTGGKLPIKNGPRRLGDPAILCAAPKRLITDLGWKPRRSELNEIVRSAWAWKQGHPTGYDADPQEVVRS
jgi:UDP-glucose 4-epimerase